MGPKKNKDVLDDENYWKLCIEETPLNDETWTVKVILMEAAGSEHDRIYLNKFENYAAEERRFVIKNICKTETIFMINQLGGEKKVKDDKLRVFEEGQVYLKEKKEVPPEITALIIKHLILKMKEEYLFIERQRLEVREGMKKESSTMISKAEIKGTVNVKISEPPQDIAPPVNKKKMEQETVSNPIEIDENKKYSTLLRVRGEEWRDKIYIDDYPLDGPNLYVAITGFLQPSLAGWLIKVGIPLTAVVQIRIDLTSTIIPSNLFRSTKRGQSQTEVLTEKSVQFWENLQQLRINKTSSNDFKNTAFVVFTPPYWNTETLSGSTEKIYDELCYLMYDIQDLTRQHLHYLDNMDIISVPEENKSDNYQKIYKRQIEEIPLESISVYLVLDAILHTVCKDTLSSRSTSSLSDSFIQKSESEENRLQKSEKLVKDLIDRFCTFHSNLKQYKVTDGNEYKNYKSIVINYGDFCKSNTFHLENISFLLDKVVCSMLSGMPLNKLWLNRDKPTEERIIRNNFHINMVLSCFDRGDVETAELNRLIHILACRKLYDNRSSLKKTHILPSTITEFKKTYLKRSILAQPLINYSFHKSHTPTSFSFHSLLTDKEESYELVKDENNATPIVEIIFDCPDISELVSVTEIANQKPSNHMIDDFEFFHNFCGSTAFQITLDAFNKYNCVDYKYCEVTDCFITMFYNNYDKEGISREEWRCHLPTPLCLQDFFDFVLEEHYDWIKNEEALYDENVLFKSQSEYKNTKNSLAANSCVDNCEVELELLMEGSLKYDEMNNMELADTETSTSKINLSKNIHTPLSTADLDSTKSGRKTKSTAISTPKIVCPESEADTNLELSKKPFFGYDLGDRRVEVFGKDSTYFAKDATRVSTFYSLLIPMNLEFVTLNMITGNFNNEFWFHKSLGDVDNPDINDINESFRINTKDQVIIYLKKQMYKITPFDPTSGDIEYKVDLAKSPSSHINHVISEYYETKSYHSLLVTWPSGLITESVHEKNSSKISHIKQHYITSLPNHNEDMRCISLNGEVIIFKNNNEIEILKSDSSYIKILKCQKRSVSEDNPESVHSVSNSDKSKKGKDKSTKITSKSSKKIVIENDKNFMNTRETEYELFIEEFETIESNGLRQKWILNDKYDIEKLLIKTATDFCLGEIFSKRSDGTTLLLNKDGDQVVTFPNNTRIITSFIIEDKEIYPEWTEEETEHFSIINFDHNVGVSTQDSATNRSKFKHANNNSTESFISKQSLDDNSKVMREDGYISVHIVYTIEHTHFTTVTINKYDGKISVKSPNDSSITFNTDNNYDFQLDKQTSAQFDGENLNIKYSACSKCNSDTRCDVKIISKDLISTSNLHWLIMTDSFNKKILIDGEGNISVKVDDTSDEILQKTHSNYSKEQLKNVNLNKSRNITKNATDFHHDCEEMWKAESLKFFILRRDLTCSELVHRAIVERCKETCNMRPWCSINQYDTFGDNRSICSILTPIHLNESEKWLMESKLSNKPKYLSYKDLVKDTGKGFYHWMRPYRRFKPKPIKPEPLLPDRLPRAFILRTLEQQWKDSQRGKLSGAKELVKAILCYRKLMEADSQTVLNVPIKDRRSENEKKTDDIVQMIANREYKDLQLRLADYSNRRAKAAITTESCSKTMSVEEFNEEIQKELQMYEEREREIKEIESAKPTSPSLKRYWQRRAEEFKEEQFYKYLLREGSVPPYFRNVLGGAIWWDMNKTADDAVASVERRRMKCVCDEE